MNRKEAFDRCLERGLTRKQANTVLRVAKQRGTAAEGEVRVGCHPYTRKYTVSKA
jgi:hypothetical protein